MLAKIGNREESEPYKAHKTNGSRLDDKNEIELVNINHSPIFVICSFKDLDLLREKGLGDGFVGPLIEKFNRNDASVSVEETKLLKLYEYLAGINDGKENRIKSYEETLRRTTEDMESPVQSEAQNERDSKEGRTESDQGIQKVDSEKPLSNGRFSDYAARISRQRQFAETTMGRT